MKNKTTWIDEDICQCTVCGAHANCPENIIHFNFCFWNRNLVSKDKFFVGRDLKKYPKRRLNEHKNS